MLLEQDFIFSFFLKPSQSRPPFALGRFQKIATRYWSADFKTQHVRFLMSFGTHKNAWKIDLSEFNSGQFISIGSITPRNFSAWDERGVPNSLVRAVLAHLAAFVVVHADNRMYPWSCARARVCVLGCEGVSVCVHLIKYAALEVCESLESLAFTRAGSNS